MPSARMEESGRLLRLSVLSFWEVSVPGLNLQVKELRSKETSCW